MKQYFNFLADIAVPTLDDTTYNYWTEFINMMLTLGFILVLIFASVYILKKIMRSKTKYLNQSTGIKIVERRVLSQKASLYLVNILGKGVVISESQAGIQLITEFSPDVDVELLLDEMQEIKKPTLSFREVMMKKLRRASPVQE